MNFLEDYLHFASENECPDSYHLWSALSVISAAISRKVWVNQGIFTYYPNIYVVLVGSAGSGKSTAMSLARGMIQQIGGIPVSADSETPQAFMRFMSGETSKTGQRLSEGCNKTWKLSDGSIYEYCPCTIIVEEFGHFINHDPTGWVLKLTDVYNREALEIRTKNMGNDYIRGPYITILACMTMETTKSMLKESIISTGFGRRSIFVWAAGRDKIVPWPKLTDSMLQARQRCIDWGKKLQLLYGEYRTGPEVYDWWIHWYTNIYKPANKANDDPSTASYFESKSMQLFKVAILIGLSTSFELEMKIEYFERALILLEDHERNLSRVFEGTGRNLSAPVAAQIMTIVSGAGGLIARKRVEREVWSQATRGKEEIDEVIRALCDHGKLFVGTIPPDATTHYLYTPEKKRELLDRAANQPAGTPPT